MAALTTVRSASVSRSAAKSFGFCGGMVLAFLVVRFRLSRPYHQKKIRD